MKNKENLIILFLCCICVFAVSLPLLGSTIYNANGAAQDTFFHTQRIWSIKNALQAGQFPVRIYSEIFNGYGYGASLMYPELFLYFPALLCLVGIPLSISYNIFLIFINIATLLIGYYAFKNITESKYIGIIAAWLYTLSVYRMVDLYTRGSMGEYLALIFCPLALCGLFYIKNGEYSKWWVLAIAYCGLLQSHILTFVIMAMLAVGFAAIHIKKFMRMDSIIAILKAVISVILWNLWFLIPFLQASGIRTEEMDGSRMRLISFIGSSGFWQTGASVPQILDVLNLTAGATEVWGDPSADCMPKTPGILLIVGSVFLVVYLIIYNKELQNKTAGYVITGGTFLFMITNLFPWKLIQKISFLARFFEKFQFIWRLNILVILFLSISAAYGFYYFFIHESKERLKSMAVLGSVVCFSALIFVNQFIKQADMYDNHAVIEMGYMDRLYVVPGFDTQGNGQIKSNIDNIEIDNVLKNPYALELDFAIQERLDEKTAVYLELPFTYYPGYQVYINNNKIDTVCSIWGVIKVYLPTDCMGGNLRVIYKESIITMIGNLISAVSILSFLLIVMKNRFYRCKNYFGGK